MRIEARDIHVRRGANPVLSGVTLAFAAGEVVALAGPNGAGKSTLLDTLCGELLPSRGELLLDGEPLAQVSLESRARRRAMLPQRAGVAFDFSVRQVVEMGLHPHGIAASRPDGQRLVEDAILDMDLRHLAARPVTRLSGGEQQRAHIARILVQARAMERPLLLLDEPTGGLDYRHQFALADVLRRAARNGATVIVSLHDLALAARVADRLLLMESGAIVGDGPPAELLTAERIAGLYGLDSRSAAGLVPQAA
ncbi:heme ABC transporter ATP-binding protein [Sandaracinobacter sp. RS1-74]|uniref:heme ABC transporter ATP-binding protein n=1 Tax=Sandaracinobacteroides sayramensis TaxID=2913411 RepID=UPI001EDA58D9|nr:heme ABC transporter ATP-binding protein [Sandaracinobacteroides sayramensis]